MIQFIKAWFIILQAIMIETLTHFFGFMHMRGTPTNLKDKNAAEDFATFSL